MESLFQTGEIFTSLVQEINHLINEDVIITNEDGTIVASTDPSRLDYFHEGAFLAMKQRKTISMTNELSKTLQGVRKGIVLPIIIENKPFGVLGITGEPEKVESYGQIIQKMAELFIKGTIDQMTQEKMARNLELFVFDWINDILPVPLLKERATFFNIQLNAYSQVISFHFPFTTGDLSYKDILVLRTNWDQKKFAIFVRWGQGKLLIIDRKYNRNNLKIKLKNFLKILQHQIGTKVFAGVGQSSEYKNLSRSFEQAERACFIAGKEKQIVFEEELKFEMIQHEIHKEIKAKFIERTIGPLLEDETILKTLSSWLDHNMSITQTAEALHIHKNTLYYRLEKIESLTKLNVRKIDDLVLFYIGNLFLTEGKDK